MNKLYYGDNLLWLDSFPSECVDLIYLDPPFNSQINYHLLYRSPADDQQAQYQAFIDAWRWDSPADASFERIMKRGRETASIISALHEFMGKSDLMAKEHASSVEIPIHYSFLQRVEITLSTNSLRDIRTAT